MHSIHAVSFFLLIDSGSEILHMASGDPDCKPLCEKEEDKRSASTVTKIPGKLLKGSSIVSILKHEMNLEASGVTIMSGWVILSYKRILKT